VQGLITKNDKSVGINDTFKPIFKKQFYFKLFKQHKWVRIRGEATCCQGVALATPTNNF